MRPPGNWGPKEFSQFTEDDLHETMMGSQPGSNYFEWAKAELEHRDRRRVLSPSEPGINAGGIDTIENKSPKKVGRIQKTVFISYRRSAIAWAQMIFQDLSHDGYDVFFDFQGIASGSFEEIILENIKARAHFIVLLTPSALERCAQPADLFCREIETAIATHRNIVPIMLEGFDFGAPGIDSQLGEKLIILKQYNGLPVNGAYVREALNRLRKYLDVPLDMVLHPASPSAERVAKDDQIAAAKAPAVSEEQLK